LEHTVFLFVGGETVIVNGQKKNFSSSITIIELIEELNLSENKIVVEVDGEIIPKENYSKQLNEDSKVEIVSFVGGG
jgi:sulfur carrier protein